MTGCMILQICNMYKCKTPDKIGLIDSPLVQLQVRAYREAMKGKDGIHDVEAQILAGKIAKQVILYPLTK